MRRERPQLRWVLILLASVALHVTVLGLLGLARTEEAPPGAQRPAPTRVELKWLSADEVDTRVAPAPAKASAPDRKSGGGATRPLAVPGSHAAPLALGGGAQDAGVGSGFGAGGDRPLATGTVLVPGYAAVLKMPEALDAAPPRGATLRNHPSERVDEAAVAEYTGEVLSRKLDEQLRGEVAAAAASVGSAPPHFRRLESSLRHTFETTPVDRKPEGDAAHVAQAILTPGVSPEAARRVTDSALGRSVQNGIGTGPNVDEQRMREAMLQMMGATEAIQERLSSVRLRTVLELTTDASGAIADVTFVERSGDERFDESVLHLTRKTALDLPEDDDARGLGASWWRTRWQYTFEPPQVKVKLLDAVRLAPR
ncbi:MAG: TonB C-terminal domain-containing protein [Myxococcota bacterium]